MSETAKNDFSERLRRLPGQLLLALVNGTAILVIVAAILAIVASSKVTHLARTVASTMTDAVLSRVDQDPGQLVQNIQRVADDVHTLTVALKGARNKEAVSLGSELERLNEQLGSLEAKIARLQDARSGLIDELIAKVGTAIGDTLQNFRACPQPYAKKTEPPG